MYPRKKTRLKQDESAFLTSLDTGETKVPNMPERLPGEYDDMGNERAQRDALDISARDETLKAFEPYPESPTLEPPLDVATQDMPKFYNVPEEQQAYWANNPEAAANRYLFESGFTYDPANPGSTGGAPQTEQERQYALDYYMRTGRKLSSQELADWAGTQDQSQWTYAKGSTMGQLGFQNEQEYQTAQGSQDTSQWYGAHGGNLVPEGGIIVTDENGKPLYTAFQLTDSVKSMIQAGQYIRPPEGFSIAQQQELGDLTQTPDRLDLMAQGGRPEDAGNFQAQRQAYYPKPYQPQPFRTPSPEELRGQIPPDQLYQARLRDAIASGQVPPEILRQLQEQYIGEYENSEDVNELRRAGAEVDEDWAEFRDFYATQQQAEQTLGKKEYQKWLVDNGLADKDGNPLPLTEQDIELARQNHEADVNAIIQAYRVGLEQHTSRFDPLRMFENSTEQYDLSGVPSGANVGALTQAQMAQLQANNAYQQGTGAITQQYAPGKSIASYKQFTQAPSINQPSRITGQEKTQYANFANALTVPSDTRKWINQNYQSLYNYWVSQGTPDDFIPWVEQYLTGEGVLPGEPEPYRYNRSLTPVTRFQTR